jgi:hypothetical protein
MLDIAMFLTAIAVTGPLKLVFSKKKYQSARSEYDEILAQSEASNDSLQSLLESLGERIFATQKQLLRAHRILEPLSRRRPLLAFHSSDPVPPTYAGTVAALTQHGLTVAALGGVGSGAIVAAGAWTAVGMLGTASTGTAIVGLHGAALTHATLAWFGGGALAYGGHGMLAGKLILAQIVFLPATFFVAFASFNKALELDQATANLREINKGNSEARWPRSKK